MFQIADLVISLSGRDQNRVFMVAEVLNSDYVLIADGMLRKLEKPKKKKIKHLEKSQFVLNERLLQKISEGKKITNAELRKSLRALMDLESEE
ncbi:MAG: RNA-binding protein [Clostridia bacterium]|nr:RNA-binding protein [Clostridia bacterium]